MRLWYVLLACVLFTAVFAGKGGLELTDADEEYETVEIQSEQAKVASTNPCNVQKCKRGETCVLDEGKPVCVCQTCQEETDEAYRVCSTKNITFASECFLDRDHCLCHNKQPGCQTEGVKKVRLDYYGACKELSECLENEYNEFPQRMRDWLFRIMRELANREQLDDYLDLLETARTDDKHADAVIWKFCDLDIDPEDRHVTRRELMFIIASIKPMEHCLVPFLNDCDANDDNTIDLVEWGTCLGIGNDLGQIEDKCKHIHDRRG